MSASRPAAPIVGICPDRRSARVAALLWGVIPARVEAPVKADPLHTARQAARDLGLAQAGQHVLLVQGFSSDPGQNTPSVTILTV